MKINSNEELRAALKPFWAAKEIALDIETTTNKSGGVLGSNGAIRTIQLGIGHPFRPQELVIDMFHVDPEAIIPFLSRVDVTWIIHNAQFERSWIYYRYGVMLENIYDTCVAWREIAKVRKIKKHKGSIYTTHSAALGAVALHEAGIELPKDCQTSDWGADVLSMRQVIYAANDVKVLFPVLSKTRERIRVEGIDQDLLAAAMQRSMTGIRARFDAQTWRLVDESQMLSEMITYADSVEELEQVWEARKTLALCFLNNETILNKYNAQKSLLTQKTVLL